MTPSTPSDQRKRVRNPKAHRAAILEAARIEFGERGYAAATIRAIAARAGVTHGLVVRHFATKEQLFVTALLESRSVRPSFGGDVSELPSQIAREYVDQIEADGPRDPFVALIRSAGDVDVAKRLLHAMRQEPADRLLSVLDDSALERRADLLGALLIGVTFSRYILADGALATMTPDELVSQLTPAIRAILVEPVGDQLVATGG